MSKNVLYGELLYGEYVLYVLYGEAQLQAHSTRGALKLIYRKTKNNQLIDKIT